jgi:tRNA pseudouridine55 synthase
VVLDKANGLSSNAALQEVKRLYEANKAGHAGSLDPLATGVLPVCLGEATKVSQFLLDSDKRYRTRIKLGIRTDTGDSEGSIIERNEGISVSRKAIERALTKFKGEVEQVPPMHSAIKMNGVPLYKLARKGITVEREPRLVTLYQICLVEFVNSELELEISCSKGTYIRTIADDLGQELGCGAHVIELRRTQAGVFTEKDSISAEELALEKENKGLDKIDQFLIPMDRAIQDLPEVNLPSITASHVKNGQAVLVRHLPKNGLVILKPGNLILKPVYSKASCGMPPHYWTSYPIQSTAGW